MKRYNLDYGLEIDDILEPIKKIRGELKDRLNYYKIPVTCFTFSEENCRLFNHIVSCLKGSYFKKIIRTPSGGISLDNRIEPAYDVRRMSSTIELTIINYGGSFRMQWRNSSDDIFEGSQMKMTGHQSFNAFRDICKKFNIDLSKYAHLDKKQALEEKESIEPAIIKVVSNKFIDKTFEGVHHIDFHSSYMSGLVNYHNEFRPIVEYIYNNRKNDNLKYKSILNMTQGYMQSELCEYRYAHLSRDMIKDNNDRIHKLVSKLLKSKRLPLLVNTDGIWYKGDIYHDENEGEGICKWSHDHKDCKFRIKSAGAYEYIENGQYYPVVRGYTKLDRIKPRSKWTWGDIYDYGCEVVTYYYKNGYLWWEDKAEGVVEYE